MGHTVANIKSISKLDFQNNTLKVEYKDGIKEVYKGVYIELSGSFMEVRSLCCDEIDFEVVMDVNYDPWELEREKRK